MKKQNILIIVVFVSLVLGYYFLTKALETEEKEIVVETVEEQETVATEIFVVETKYCSVYLVGELERTGHFKIPIDWTVRMLFEFAGLKDTGNIESFNLGDIVVDNETYYVPKITNSINVSEKININTCTVEELKTIKGIGDVIANRIIEYRKTKPFQTISDVKNVSGIGDALYEKIKDYITVR